MPDTFGAFTVSEEEARMLSDPPAACFLLLYDGPLCHETYLLRGSLEVLRDL